MTTRSLSDSISDVELKSLARERLDPAPEDADCAAGPLALSSALSSLAQLDVPSRHAPTTSMEEMCFVTWFTTAVPIL